MEDLKILLVEDNPGDAFLVEEMLEDIQEVNAEITHIETLKEAITELEQSVYDVVLLDLGLPDSEGLNALKKVLEIDLGFPVIVITGLDDGKTGNEAVKSGAQSYMVKGQLTSASISQTILYSIERTKFLKKLKVKEAEVIEKNKVLEEVLSSKNLLISIISHDLRGPLNSIISLLEILDSDYDELEEKTKKKYLNAILSSAKSTHNLMENLLHWAQIQSKRRKVEPEEVGINQLIQQGTEPLKPVAEEKEITLEFDVPENLAVYADEKMICTVIRNLVSNALKFTPRKGKIKVTSEKSTNNQIIVSIEDNGVGMDKDVLSTFFDNRNTAFTKGTEDEPGSGFGLILVKEFVEKNNGKLIIESKEGQGTKVSFTLPHASSS